MRIKLKKIEKHHFTTTVKVRITDLNYGNHLSNEMALSYAQQARVDLLKHLGNWGELTLAGCGIIMTDAAVVYKAEAFAGDILEIAVAIDDISRVGFDLYYQIRNAATQKVISEVKTGIVCFDYSTHKVAAIPQKVTAAIHNLIQHAAN